MIYFMFTTFVSLGFCVDRHDIIQSFSPEDFWTLVPTIEQGSLRVPLEWERGRVFDVSVAGVFESLIKTKVEATLISYTNSQGSKQRPKPLNTVELLKIASKQLGMGPHTTMQVAEKLFVFERSNKPVVFTYIYISLILSYTQGYISYPRTETSKYPTHFNFQETLQAQASNRTWCVIL
jgi:DNA topoisomerase III